MNSTRRSRTWTGCLELGCEPGKERTPALRVNSIYGIYRAVKSGLGIAALPYYIMDESPDLVHVLPDVLGPSMDAYFVYPEELRWSKRVAVIRDFLIEQVKEEQDLAPQEQKLPAGA